VRAVTITPGDLLFENGWALTESYKLGITEPGLALVDETGDLIAFFGRSATYAKPWADIDLLPYATTTPEERAQIDLTPEVRVKGEQPDGTPIYKTRADVPAGPLRVRRTNRDRRPATLESLRGSRDALVLKASDGTTCYRVSVTNAGVLTTASVTCP